MSNKLYDIMRDGTDDDILNAIRTYVPYNSYHLFNPVRPLHQAVSAKRINIVRKLLDMGHNVNAKDMYNGYYPIHLLVEDRCQGDLSIAKLLLERGADIEAKDENGYTILFNAAKKGKTHLVKFLLEYGANTKSSTNNTLMMHAVTSKKISTVKCIINHDKELLNPDSIIPALCNSDTKMLRFLIESGVDINKRNSYRKTALHYAIEKNNDANLIKILLDNNADINATDDQGQTPLHIATNIYYISMDHPCISSRIYSDVDKTVQYEKNCENRFRISKMLIYKGANVNAVDENNTTPLHNASKSVFMIKTLKLLIDKGADINAIDNYGIIPLNYACTSIYYILYVTNDIIGEKIMLKDDIYRLNYCKEVDVVVNTLLENGADVNFVDRYGRSPLHYASVSSHVKIVESLVKHGIELFVTDKKGNSPLHYASSNNACVHIVQYLIKKGINPNSRNSLGRTPLFYSLCMPEIVITLLNNGANVNIADNRNRTPLNNENILILPETHYKYRAYIDSLKHIVKSVVLEGSIHKNSYYFNNVEILDRFGCIRHLKILCEEELETMKSVKINKIYTLYDILCNNKHIKMNKYIKDINLSSFPQYTNYINIRIEEIIHRNKLLDECLYHLDNILLNNNNYWDMLPIDARYQIISCMDNKELELTVARLRCSKY
ncbi:ankyrin repeat protein [Fowlpox virus]|nr:ankyrin repeat protein [Fowlpox virus]